MRTLRLAAVISIAAAVALAADTAPRAARRSAPAAGNQDRQIEADIRARFARSKVAEDKFQVHVQNGIATIEGRTGVIQRKGVATRMAKNAGAKQVVNRIEITEAARQRAARNLRRPQLKRSQPRSER
ncbi:MAG: BON domain-containing protein [Acidobacteriota bacterium]